jgi:anti-repressor protein
MQELIPITESSRNGKVVYTVDARLLHEKLGSKQQFGNWIVNRLNQFSCFKENIDYWVFNKIINNPLGGRPSKDYALSLNMAKELSMVENNDMGHQFRLYFIECQERLMSIGRQELSDEELMTRALIIANRKIEADKPKVIFHDAVTAAEGDIEVGEMATILNNAGYKTTRNKLFEELREMGLLIKVGLRCNMPTQKAVDKGYIKQKGQILKDRNGVPTLSPNGKEIYIQTAVITPVGQQYFIDYFTKKRQQSLLDNLLPKKLSILEH